MFSAAATKLLAIGVLAGMGLALVLCLAVLMRRLPLTPLQSFLYVCNVAVARLLWRARVSPLPVPDNQGAVIVSNHLSPIDPCFIELTTKRAVHWMVAKEYCAHPASAWFLRACEVIPVSRGGIDTTATKRAIRYLEDGGLVGIFPEGRINTTRRVLLPGRPGAALIALKARVPVIPCYISGSPFDGTIWHSLFTPATVRLQFGRPIDVSEFYGREREREVLEHLTRRFLSEIAALAGKRDYQPELAGRFYRPGETSS